MTHSASFSSPHMSGWVEPIGFQQPNLSALQAIRMPEQGRSAQEQSAQALRVTRQAEQTLRASNGLRKKEVMSRSARRNKQKTFVPRDANGTSCDDGPPWCARKSRDHQEYGVWRAIWSKVKESGWEFKSWRISDSVRKARFVSLLERDEGGFSQSVVDEKPFGQGRERDEEGTNRTAELRSSQVSADKGSDDTHKKILELEDAMAALRAENNIRAQERDCAAQNSTKGTEEQNLEGSSSRRVSPE